MKYIIFFKAMGSDLERYVETTDEDAAYFTRNALRDDGIFASVNLLEIDA